ncbi:hypothetical protein HDU91_000457 [Kappamyces sp. JEL0680]|nr:hypothetical protein HDU91_000457 [Kappamyces sp. JEL0680]
MCICFYFKSKNPSLSLVIAGNRDELLGRKSLALHWWRAESLVQEPEQADRVCLESSSRSERVKILCGTDESLVSLTPAEPHGTWMGIALLDQDASEALPSETSRDPAAVPQLKFAFLTNVREPSSHLNPQATSRGFLIRDYLHRPQSASDYVEQLAAKSLDFNGFNLVVGSLAGPTYYLGNRSCQPPVLLEDDHFYGLSNGPSLLPDPDDPQQWPKVKKGTLLFESIVAPYCTQSSLEVPLQQLETQLFELLSTKSSCAQSHHSPDTQATDYIMVDPYERSELGGRLFGTRTQTVIVVLASGQGVMAERDVGTGAITRVEFVL